ncbi:hypothetical protein CXY01_20150 [Cellulomonas xylanilytica]|uniref:Uncharacterized protein n=1 Tax=Cellulomonas xylanilytica TaxID=233583 RepID=A0A510V8L0_9CELL|nr:hypothetical protein CXY01_20150 [Cellulomonas xylanilytica]
MEMAESGVAGSADVTSMVMAVPGASPAQPTVNELPTDVVVTLRVQDAVGCGTGVGSGVTVGVGVGVDVSVGVGVIVGVGVAVVSLGFGTPTATAAVIASGESARAATATAVTIVRELRFIRQSPVRAAPGALVHARNRQ